MGKARGRTGCVELLAGKHLRVTRCSFPPLYLPPLPSRVSPSDSQFHLPTLNQVAPIWDRLGPSETFESCSFMNLPGKEAEITMTIIPDSKYRLLSVRGFVCFIFATQKVSDDSIRASSDVRKSYNIP